MILDNFEHSLDFGHNYFRFDYHHSVADYFDCNHLSFVDHLLYFVGGFLGADRSLGLVEHFLDNLGFVGSLDSVDHSDFVGILGSDNNLDFVGLLDCVGILGSAEILNFVDSPGFVGNLDSVDSLDFVDNPDFVGILYFVVILLGSDFRWRILFLFVGSDFQFLVY